MTLIHVEADKAVHFNNYREETERHGILRVMPVALERTGTFIRRGRQRRKTAIKRGFSVKLSSNRGVMKITVINHPMSHRLSSN